jgi:hypothetical protein
MADFAHGRELHRHLTNGLSAMVYDFGIQALNEKGAEEIAQQ